MVAVFWFGVLHRARFQFVQTRYGYNNFFPSLLVNVRYVYVNVSGMLLHG